MTFVESRVNQPVEAAAFSTARLGLVRGDTIHDKRTEQKYLYEGE